jgi:GTP-binding protein
MAELPVIAIVGRPNVGKSSLLNALVGRRISIVQDEPGVTRDRVSTPLAIDGRFVELVDTGGYGFEDPDKLTEHIRQQIELAMSRANLVLFIVDTEAGLTGGDQQIASLLRRQGLKTVLVANKTDGPKADVALGEFARLGFGTPIGVSAMNDRNLDQLVTAIEQNVDLANAPTEMPAPQLMLAIVGKRNAGKSTFVNAIASFYEGDPQRVIVSEVPGTTRDSIDVRFEKEGKTLVVIDTAGVRKKRQMVTHDIEFYSFHRAQRSIRRADVVLMLIDGIEHVSEPDKQLARYIADQLKPVIIVVNKWDLVLANAQKQAEAHHTTFSSDLLMQEFSEYLNLELPHIDYAPIAFITAKDGKNVQQVIDLAQHLFKQANTRITTGELNKAVQQILAERVPSTPAGQRVKVFYATQTDVAPPTIVLFVNNADYVNETYQRFMINRFRELLPYDEVPIKLVIRSRVRGQGSDEDLAEGARPIRKRQSPTSKPRPKKSKRRGPSRGTRPK